MYRFVIVIVILVLCVRCIHTKIELDPSSIITTKFIVLDEQISPKNTNCSEVSVPYLRMQENDCSFKIGPYEFDIEKKYVMDTDGNLKSFWKYLSEGPLIYSIDELNRDVEYMKY